MAKKRARVGSSGGAAAPAAPERRHTDTPAAQPRRERIWPSLLLIAVLCTIFMGVVHGFDGKDLDRGYDWAECFSFQRDFVAEAWQKGEFPLWCPYTFGGRPFAADPQTQCFYPATLLWLLLPKMTAFTLDTLLHYILGGICGFFFLRSLGVRSAFAVWGGAAFTMSGFNPIHIAAGHINFHAALAWLPLAFWCVERAVGGRRAYWLWGGGVLGIQFLAGSIPVSWMTFLFSGLYAVVRSAWPFERRRFVEGVVGFSAMAALGVGVAAVQLLPTAEFATQGVRNTHSYEYATYQDLPPRNLVNLIFPHGKIDGPGIPEDRKLIPEGEFNGYMGLLALGLGAAGFALLRRRPEIAGFVGIVCLASPLMLGDSTPIFRLLWWVLPGVSALRNHCREILLISFAFIGAGAIALEEFARAGEARSAASRSAPRAGGSRALDAALWSGLALLAIGAAAGFLTFAGNPTAPPWQMAMIVVAFPALFFARRKAALPAVAFGLVGLSFLDMTANAAAFDPWYTHVRGPAPDTEEPIARVLTEDGGLFRGHFHKRAYRRERFISDRFSGVDGYEALIPRRWYELIHALSDTPIKDYLVAEATQDMFYKRPTTFPFRVLNVKYTTVQQPDRSYRLVVNPDPDPRAFLAAEAMVVPDDAAATALLKSAAFDPRKTAILDSDPPPDVARGAAAAGASAPGVAASPSPPPGTGAAHRTLSKDGRISTTEAGRCEVLDWGLNSQRLRVASDRPAILVESEGWFPGWTATVDGRAAPLYRTHVTLRGVAVPAGEHEVVFRYRPRSVLLGALVSALSAALMATGLVVVRRRERSGA